MRTDEAAAIDDAGRVEDQFRSLMEGLRTTLPGVQVLFAFLLTLPLQRAFSEISQSERIIYYVAFVSSAFATVLLIAPSVHQRLRSSRSGITRHHHSHVMAAVRIANAGTIFTVVALGAAAYLVSTLVFGSVVAAVATGLLGVVAGLTWFYLPLIHWR